MDTITLAGPLEAKLRAIREAGFTHVMLNATDIAGHPAQDNMAAALAELQGLCAFYKVLGAYPVSD